MALVQGPSLPTLTPMSVQGTGWTTINISYVVTHALYLPHVIFPDTLQVGGIVSLLQVGNVELRAGTWLPGVSTVVDSCLPGHVPLPAVPPLWLPGRSSNPPSPVSF